MVSNSRTVNNIIGALLAIILTFLCFGSTYAVEPEKPWPEDLGDGDRLYASYLNGMFGVLYNWCQNKQIILDNLLNNGNGVASVTARLGKFDNLSVPELDNLLHNGNGIASLTSNLLKALQEVEAPLYKINGRADAPSVNTDDGYIYYDIDTQRLMGYQEGHWRDLSPVTIIGTDSLHSPLIIEGYLETTNSYVENRVVIGNASESHNEIGTASAKIDFGNDGAIRIPVNSNPNQLNTEFGTGSIAYNPTTKKLLVYDGTNWISPVPEITVDSSISSTSTNPVQNKEVYRFIAQTESNSFYYIAEAIRNVVKNVHNQMTDITGVPTLNSWPIGGTTSHDTPLLQEAYESFKALIDYVRSATLNSAKTYADTVAATTLSSAKTYADGKTTTVDTAMSGTSTHAVQNKVIKSYIDTKDAQTLASASLYVDNKLSSSSNVNVNGVWANTLQVNNMLRLPLSTVSNAPIGSLAYNSTSSKLQYKDASGWKDIIQSAGGSGDLNINIKNVTCRLDAQENHVSGNTTNVTHEYYDVTTKLIEVGEHIVVWAINDTNRVWTTDLTFNVITINKPDELYECGNNIIANIGDASGQYYYVLDLVGREQYYNIDIYGSMIGIIVRNTSKQFDNKFSIPPIFIIGFK